MIYLLLNIIILFFNILIVRNVKKIPYNMVIYDHPDNIRKIHTLPVPLLGGYIFFLSFIVNLIFFYKDLNFDLFLLISLLFLSSFFLILGLNDDRSSLTPSKKTIIILILLFLIIPFNEKLIVNSLIFKNFDYVINLNQANIFFTIFCIYFFFNLINFSDGANGITVSLGIFWLIIFIIFGSLNDYFLIFLLLSLILILVFNLQNKLFLGNSGSSVISVVFAALFIINYNVDYSIKCDEIFLLMFLPAIDTIRVTINRIIKNKSPFDPDKNHFHHLLLRRFSKDIIFLPYTLLSVLPFLLSSFINTLTVFICSIIIYFVLYLFLIRD
tara:strand:- start:212 stop:1192 length:981 start_codon:yes stop_codon:yes gene_type:complete